MHRSLKQKLPRLTFCTTKQFARLLFWSPIFILTAISERLFVSFGRLNFTSDLGFLDSADKTLKDIRSYLNKYKLESRFFPWYEHVFQTTLTSHRRPDITPDEKVTVSFVNAWYCLRNSPKSFRCFCRCRTYSFHIKLCQFSLESFDQLAIWLFKSNEKF